MLTLQKPLAKVQRNLGADTKNVQTPEWATKVAHYPEHLLFLIASCTSLAASP
jgi:hypothetical protein